MKRKAEEINDHQTNQSPKKKRSIKEPNIKSTKKPKSEDIHSSFRKGLFDKDVLEEYTTQYSKSSPYKHAVIDSLINDSLLRNVRTEIQENVHFTPKETDIYKIHQSGDLANLDGLEDEALAKLPSLLKLRNSLYSKEFRDYIGTVTGVGKGGLSGKKTDMAVNVYVPGCYLLCHDDVIGSRRVSWILYLTDPDLPWKSEWGGALRLFPTIRDGDKGKDSYTPAPDTMKSIPPAWNQLSFFMVEPGKSFHDVEQVYYAETKEALEKEGGRIRMAISGWFHIPQEGEEGYIPGLEESLASKSSLTQLQGKDEQQDFPKENKTTIDRSSGPQELEDKDFEFLLKFMAPAYLTPDTMESVTEHFGAASSITLDGLLSKKFAARLKYEIEKLDAKTLPGDTETTEKECPGWKVARPPHKHRFMYKHPVITEEKAKLKESETPALDELLNVFLPSRQFRQWLELATECEIEDCDLLARRFRRGRDYALATSHEGKPRLELSLGLTPSEGWIIDEDDEEEDEQESSKKTNPKSKAPKENPQIEVGGTEIYMASDDTSPSNPDTAATYKTSTSTDIEEDPILFSISPAWNTLSLVLRDSGALRFMAFVGKEAKGDRWDVFGVLGVGALDDDEEEDEGEEGEGEKKDSQETVVTLEDLEESDGEETWNGFPDSGDSESD